MGSTQCDLCLGRRFGEAPGRHSKAHATQAPLCSLEGRRAWAGGRLEPQGGSSAAARAARLTIRRFLGRERLALFGAHDQIHCHCEPILVKLAVLRLDQALTWAGRTSTQVEVGGRQVGGRQGRVQPSVWQVASCASIPPTLHHPPTHPRIHRSIDICLPSICLPVYLSIARLPLSVYRSPCPHRPSSRSCAVSPSAVRSAWVAAGSGIGAAGQARVPHQASAPLGIHAARALLSGR